MFGSRVSTTLSLKCDINYQIEKQHHKIYLLIVIRYHKLLLYLGIPTGGCRDLKAQTFCKTLAEFALEYKITREKIILQEAIMAKKEKQRQQQVKKKITVDVSILNSVTSLSIRVMVLGRVTVFPLNFNFIIT